MLDMYWETDYDYSRKGMNVRYWWGRGTKYDVFVPDVHIDATKSNALKYWSNKVAEVLTYA